MAAGAERVEPVPVGADDYEARKRRDYSQVRFDPGHCENALSGI